MPVPGFQAEWSILMDYKTIVLIAKTMKEAEFTAPFAIDLARRMRAQLKGLNAIPDFLSVYWDGDVGVQASTLKEQQSIADDIEGFVRSLASQSDVEADWYSARSGEQGAVRFLVEHARSSDLIVTNAEPGYPKFLSNSQPHEELIFSSGRPVFLVPNSTDTLNLDRVVIAWNNDPACARALCDSIPLLKRAREVTILNAPTSNSEMTVTSINGVHDLLARHGISSSSHVLETNNTNVGSRLFDWAVNREAGMMVMGAYAHSRLREFVFGGATKYAIEQLPLPVLFSH
jgi:nucleotide-binding universal stress UspA family protein